MQKETKKSKQTRSLRAFCLANATGTLCGIAKGVLSILRLNNIRRRIHEIIENCAPLGTAFYVSVAAEELGTQVHDLIK